MERASRLQLQQHANSAQPSVTGGVESRPSGLEPGRPWRKVDRTTKQQSKTFGPFRSSSQIGPTSQTFKTSSPNIPKFRSSQNLGTSNSQTCSSQFGSQVVPSSHRTKSQTLNPNIRVSELCQRPDRTGSQQSVKVTRFQLERDRQTKM